MDVLKGKHCSVDECKQFDFLPFNCSLCDKTFCLQHREQSAHKCTALAQEKNNILPKCPLCNKYVLIKSGESADTKMNQHIDSGCTQYMVDRKQESKPACTYSKCKAVRAPCECRLCRKWFCPQHRLADDHLCPYSDSGPKKKGARGGKLFNPFKAKLNDIQNDKNKNKNQKNKNNSAKFDPAKDRIRLRSVAKGNKNIESEQRFYLEIKFSGALKKKPLSMFFNKSKTVGRILDEICDERNIKNNNHIASARQLVLECCRTGGDLPMDVELRLMQPEFQSGDTVLIHYEDE
eukprot:CAMPEP_0202704698 /NCGR_PEP_ID=MMETSP1385-20130828/17336_1 /ASSEMBLY_ACC=CAM_ASM_000861 /TAXON_ID=933848 /ORGANISM="Elphidium margaritaceum" /LENGTH=291 /DNA_ID=CAMNT_0049362783 /DNA_START=18 /DNA_END=893 /DNA_ORIENTATION=-